MHRTAWWCRRVWAFYAAALHGIVGGARHGWRCWVAQEGVVGGIDGGDAALLSDYYFTVYSYYKTIQTANASFLESSLAIISDAMCNPLRGLDVPKRVEYEDLWESTPLCQWATCMDAPLRKSH